MSLAEQVDALLETEPDRVMIDGVAVAVGGVDCVVPAAERPSFDALLELSDAEIDQAISDHAEYGVPNVAMNSGDIRGLVNREYVIGYDADLKLPLYASYVLEAADIVTRSDERCFRDDPRLSAAERSETQDYVEPIFDRGHLVARADLNRSRETVVNSYFMSNIMPQHDQFNQGVWKKFESLVRAWAKSKGRVHVVSGPIFDGDGSCARDDNSDATRVRPRGRVGIPSHFYKAVLHERQNGFIDAIAIILPHTDDEVPIRLETEEELAYLSQHIVPIDQVERMTGIDFFHELPDHIERAVEASLARGLWGDEDLYPNGVAGLALCGSVVVG